jgi:CNT family concentrative nucleoside transporter
VSERFISAFGLVAMMGLAWGMSENRRQVNVRLVVIGVGLQILLGLLILRTDLGQRFFDWVRGVFAVFANASNEGASFVFGELTTTIPVAFSVLPLVIVASSVAGILYHVGLIQAVVKGMAWLMQKSLKTSGAETFGTAMLIFLGIESMTTVKGYLKTMTRSELLTLMTAFMATVAASVLFAYASFGAEPGHLLAASIMSAPAAIVISKILVPETETPSTSGSVSIEVEVESHNVIDGATRGASDGVMLAINIGALLITMISLVFLLNLGLESFTGLFMEEGITFTDVMSWVFIPFAWLMGVPSQDVTTVAQLLGTKTILNEFLAYGTMQGMIESGSLSPRAILIATYALCGFANPGSLGILLAGLSGLVPERRKDITALGIKSFVAGTLAVFMTACVAGILG